MTLSKIIDQIKEKYPKVVCEKQVTRANKTYWIIRIKNNYWYLATGDTKKEAWQNAFNKINEKILQNEIHIVSEDDITRCGQKKKDIDWIPHGMIIVNVNSMCKQCLYNYDWKTKQDRK